MKRISVKEDICKLSMYLLSAVATAASTFGCLQIRREGLKINKKWKHDIKNMQNVNNKGHFELILMLISFQFHFNSWFDIVL